MITITLSKKVLNISSTGYQPPIPEDQVRPSNNYDNEGEGSPDARDRGLGGRGRGRVRGMYNGPGDYDGGGYYGGQGYGGRGRGRGRSQNFRGDEEVIMPKDLMGIMTMAKGKCLLPEDVSWAGQRMGLWSWFQGRRATSYGSCLTIAEV